MNRLLARRSRPDFAWLFLPIGLAALATVGACLLLLSIALLGY